MGFLRNKDNGQYKIQVSYYFIWYPEIIKMLSKVYVWPNFLSVSVSPQANSEKNIKFLEARWFTSIFYSSWNWISKAGLYL